MCLGGGPRNSKQHLLFLKTANLCTFGMCLKDKVLFLDALHAYLSADFEAFVYELFSCHLERDALTCRYLYEIGSFCEMKCEMKVHVNMMVQLPRNTTFSNSDGNFCLYSVPHIFKCIVRAEVA